MNPPVLHDIHLPDANLWWPPAPGWWISLLLILLLLWLLPRLLRWLKYKPLKSLSLTELERIRVDHKQGLTDKEVLNQVAALLRRVSISFCGREQSAAITGEQWLVQLRRLAPDNSFSEVQLEWLAHARYRAHTELDVDSLLLAAERWLRALPRSTDHVSA